jgi:transcriptional regulator with XRE-family HTH domain
MVPDQEFAADLDRLRIVRGLSLRDLVRATGVARSTLSDALAGRRLPRLQTVLAVVRACDGDIELWRQRWAALAGPFWLVATARPPRPAELPRDVVGFTGRDQELHRLQSGPLWVVHGPPGVGKTALAVHWAYQVAAGYPDGQLFLDLHGHHRQLAPMSASNALFRLLRSLGIQPIPVGVAERSRLLRSILATKRMVIVLDDAVSADQVRPMLPGESGCSVLVTSRHHLIELTALDGAAQLALDVLRPESSAAVIAQVAGAARVLAKPAETAAIAAACGYLPLALRLVAATLAADPTLGIDELSRRLAIAGDRYRVLPDVGRHLDAVFATSYRSLDPDGQLVFRRLGLHPDAEPDLAVAATLAELPTERFRAALSALAEAHLVEAAGSGRYRTHALLHEYAGRLLAATEGPGTIARLRDRLTPDRASQLDSAEQRTVRSSSLLF